MAGGRSGGRDAVVVELPGRVGNQLFAVAAGYVAAHATGRRLRVDLSSLRRGRERPGEILGFDWSFDPTMEFGEFPRRGLSAEPFRGAARLEGAATTLTGGRLPGTLRARGSGHDARLDAAGRYGRVVGYFQSARHVAAACALGFPRTLAVREPGGWLRDLTARAASEAPLVVVVRLGDYREADPVLGLLGPEYFRRGLELLDPEGSRRVWLFCDEGEGGLAFLPPDVRSRTWVVPQPVGVAKEQVLLGASLGRDYVIANSTFAWWAAWMSGADSRVAVPDPWFRRRTVDGIRPESWAAIPWDWAAQRVPTP
jgi:hypothetical protein